MPNLSGKNGYEQQSMPPDNELRDFLTELSKENNGRGAAINDQMAALKAHFGITIGRSSLFELRKRLEIPSVRLNPRSKQRQVQALVEVTEKNVSGSWGVGQTRGQLAQAGILATRDTVREFNIDFYPHQVEQRLNSTKARIPRKAIEVMGPLHQLHLDGHEKIGEQALQIGEGIGLSFYGARCAWSSRVMMLVLTPNVRCQKTIGHVYLDWIEGAGYVVPFTAWTDGGTEVGELRLIQDRLRQLGAPDVNVQQHPPTRHVKSVHNTPIEAFWSWQRKDEGHDMKNMLLSGRELYNARIPFHKNLFYWIWVPVIQGMLDKYRDFYNSHALRKQKNKLAPTGVSPNLLFHLPQQYDVEASDCSVSVRQEWVMQERERLGGMEERARLFEWYPEEFNEVAHNAWSSIGEPTIELENAWEIFETLTGLIEGSEVQAE